jgi:hypothetical protein
MFIVGCPRSGTTLVQSILAAHSMVLSFPESHFFLSYRRTFLRGYEKTEECAKQLATFLEIATGSRDGTQERVRDFERNASTSMQIKWFLRTLDGFADDAKKVYWIEKTPDHIQRIPLIEKHASESIFIHVLRHPDTNIPALFLAMGYWGKRRSSWLRSCFHWYKVARITQRHAGLPRHVVIFYEDLIRDPHGETLRLQRDIGLPVENDLLDRRTENLSKIIDDREHWKKDVSRDIGAVTEVLPTPPWYVSSFSRSKKLYDDIYRKEWRRRSDERKAN